MKVKFTIPHSLAIKTLKKYGKAPNNNFCKSMKLLIEITTCLRIDGQITTKLNHGADI